MSEGERSMIDKVKDGDMSHEVTLEVRRCIAAGMPAIGAYATLSDGKDYGICSPLPPDITKKHFENLVRLHVRSLFSTEGVLSGEWASEAEKEPAMARAVACAVSLCAGDYPQLRASDVSGGAA